MVGAAIGGAVGVARAAIVVTGRMNAIGRFAALSAAIGTADKAMGGFGRTTLKTAGIMTLMSAATKLLMNPVTGLLALANTGLATYRMVRYQEQVQRTEFQMRLLGFTTEDINTRLGELTRRYGILTTTALLQGNRGFAEASELGDAWAFTLADMAEQMRFVTDVDIEQFLLAASRALKTNAIPDVKELARVLDLEFIPGVTTAEGLLREFQDTLDETDPTPMQNLAKETETFEERFIRVFSGLPLIITSALAAVLGFVNDTIALWNRLEKAMGLDEDAPLTQTFKRLSLFMDALPSVVAGSIADIATLNWDTLRERWKTLFDSTIIDENMKIWLGLWRDFFTVDIPAIWSDFVDNIWKPLWESDLVDAIKTFTQSVIPGLFEGGFSMVLSNIKDIFLVDMPQFFMSLVGVVFRSIIEGVINPILRAIDFGITKINRMILAINESPAIKALLRLTGTGGIPYLSPVGQIDLPPQGPILGPNRPGIIPLTETFPPRAVINIYIGDEKIDTVVLNSLSRTSRRAGLSPLGMTSI